MIKKKLIMVMGVQRSGTNALFYSLARDPTWTSYNEAADDELYEDFFLRPEPQIRPILERASGGVLLKPNSETRRRSLSTVLEEYAAYDLHIVWIYRDPVNVFYSFYTMGWTQYSDIANPLHLREWNERNRSALEAQHHDPARIIVLKYEDAVADPSVLQAIFLRLGLRGEDRLRGDTNAGRERLPRNMQAEIDTASCETRIALDRARTFKPTLLTRFKHRFQARFNPTAVTAVPAVRACSPAAIPDLYFWLQGQALGQCRDGEPAGAWRDQGPYCMVPVAKPEPPRYLVNQLAGYPAVRFGCDAERVEGLAYGIGVDWSFCYDGSPFTVALVIRPCTPAGSSETLSYPICIGALGNIGASFVLGWADATKTWMATITPSMSIHTEKEAIAFAAYPAQREGNNQWHVLVCRHAPRPRGDNLSLWVNLMPVKTGVKNSAIAYAQGHSRGVLELGGVNGSGGPRFAGDIAEVVIFRRALDESTRVGLTNHLLFKYSILKSEWQ